MQGAVGPPGLIRMCVNLAVREHRIEIRQPARIDKVSPTQPQHLQPLAHRPVGMGRLRLDPRADDIAHQTVHRRRDPWVVPRIPPGPPRRRGRAREDRRVQPIDGPRPLPATTIPRRAKCMAAETAEKAVEQAAHAGRVAWQG